MPWMVVCTTEGTPQTALKQQGNAHSAGVRQILERIGVGVKPPRITPARGPALWDECDAQVSDGVDVEPDWDEAAQVAPAEEVDQRISW